MKHHRNRVFAATGVAAVAALVAAALIVVPALATPSNSGFSSSTIARAQLDALDIKGETDAWELELKTKGRSDLFVQQNLFRAATASQPAGSSGWHTHPGPSLIIVTQGTVTVYEGDDPTCTPHEFSASQGKGFVDIGGGAVHLIRNEGTVDAQTIVVQMIPAGAARRIDAPDPGNCSF
jgi:quercetin dioxygenase-like cupin family protein